jgi:hypothetical protein
MKFFVPWTATHDRRFVSLEKSAYASEKLQKALAPMADAPAIIPDMDDWVTGDHVAPPSIERARTFVASVLFPATHTPFEYPRELQIAKGAETSLAATTDHVPESVALGRDDIAKTFVPLPPIIQRATPVPCDPPRPYATVSADVEKGVYVEMMLLY